jgi:intergrase/recombinase
MSVTSSTIELTNKQKEAPMDQQVYPTIINTTEDFLKSEIVKKDERIAQLEEHIQKVTQRSYADSADKNRMVEAMQEWTLGALEHGTIDESEAEEISEICGFDLTKEFEVEVTVMYSVTVNARDEESATNAIHDIDFDTVQYNSDNISWLSSSIDRVDI